MIPPYPFSSGEVGEIRTDSDAVTLVDIGGGFGQAVKKLHAEYPDLKGRFILQDLPKTINEIDVAQAKKEGFEPRHMISSAHSLLKEPNITTSVVCCHD